jgi:hypothetical protein
MHVSAGAGTQRVRLTGGNRRIAPGRFGAGGGHGVTMGARCVLHGNAESTPGSVRRHPFTELSHIGPKNKRGTSEWPEAILRDFQINSSSWLNGGSFAWIQEQYSISSVLKVTRFL